MNLRVIIIGIGIFILTMFVAIYGTSVFMPMPEYQESCPPMQTQQYIDNPTMCQQLGGYWIVDNYPRQVDGKNITGYCDTEYYCRQEFENASEDVSRNRFLVSIPLGIAIMVAGNAIFALETVGVGLMAGGARTSVWGAGNYWGYASDVWRFIISLIGLVALIWFAYWFEKRNKNFFGKFLGKR